MRYHPDKEACEKENRYSSMTDDRGIFCTKGVEKMVDILEAMNTIVCGLNDETAYFDSWIYIVPDEADREDLRIIVKDQPDIFEDAIKAFVGIVKHYMK